MHNVFDCPLPKYWLFNSDLLIGIYITGCKAGLKSLHATWLVNEKPSSQLKIVSSQVTY